MYNIVIFSHNSSNLGFKNSEQHYTVTIKCIDIMNSTTVTIRYIYYTYNIIIIRLYTE